MIDKIEREPQIEVAYGGPAMADEVFNELFLMQNKINELVEVLNEHLTNHPGEFRLYTGGPLKKSHDH